jgi:Cu+-exporting ATPase
MQQTITKPFAYGLAATFMLLGLYFFIITLASGWAFAQSQFVNYWYFIVSLSVGFGIQMALYQYIKDMVQSGHGMGKIVGVSGATSTAAMISCCAHYLVNLVPILGVTGLITFVAQYQVKLFWVGILFSIAGIVFMARRIYTFKHS